MNGEQAQQLERIAEELNVMEIGFKRLSENAVLPTKANPTDSGLDLYAASGVVIPPGETVVIPTDLAIELPEGFEAVVRPRSGITSKTKLRVQLGTIDNEYKGAIGVIVDNISSYVFGKEYEKADVSHVCTTGHHDNLCYAINAGDKIAQLVIQPIPQTVAVEIAELSDGERGANGFGSSGV